MNKIVIPVRIPTIRHFPISILVQKYGLHEPIGRNSVNCLKELFFLCILSVDVLLKLFYLFNSFTEKTMPQWTCAYKLQLSELFEATRRGMAISQLQFSVAGDPRLVNGSVIIPSSRELCIPFRVYKTHLPDNRAHYDV